MKTKFNAFPCKLYIYMYDYQNFSIQFLFGHLMYVALTLHIIKLEFLGPSKQERSYGEGGGGQPPQKKKKKKKKIMLNVKQMDKEKTNFHVPPWNSKSPSAPLPHWKQSHHCIQVSGTVITEIANRLE